MFVLLSAFSTDEPARAPQVFHESEFFCGHESSRTIFERNVSDRLVLQWMKVKAIAPLQVQSLKELIAWPH
jgi:hypothetical protein